MKIPLLSLIIITVIICVANAQKKIPASCPDAFMTHKNGGRQALRFAANHPLNNMDTAVKMLFIYVHGINRNGLDYFNYAQDLVKSTNKENETLLIAPQFADEEDLDYYHLNNDFLYWKKSEWKDGYTAQSASNRPQREKMSSYEVMDSLIVNILASGAFPNIKTVVVAGHSAGGQFVQRYSAITPVPDGLTSVKFRFIVMDPSSYMYADAKRPTGNNSFTLPDSSGCPEYNRYPKGLNDLNTYAKAIGAEHIRKNIFQRDIIFLLGGKDTKTDDPNLDVSCAANLEGRFRLERGENYFNYLSQFPEYGNKTNLNIVMDSGHNGEKMINSAEARKWIYGM